MFKNYNIPNEGEFSMIYKKFRRSKKFAEAVRNGGAIVILNKNKPILCVKLRRDGKTLYTDNEKLFNEWFFIYGIIGKEYLKAFCSKKG